MLGRERGIGRRRARAGAALLALTTPAGALDGGVPSLGVESRAAAGQAVRVWYRSSDGCPDGAAFIELLHRHGREGTLAGVGDRVDFVVTVASAPEQSSGRLERESSAGTVAIREVSAATCAEVAQVLALSVDLAIQPEPRPSDGERGASMAELAPAPSDWALRFGGQGLLVTGLAHAVLPGAAAFVDVGPARPAWSARLSLRGAYGSGDVAVPLTLALWAARAEACWTWAAGAVELGPCAGIDAGALRAEGEGNGGRRDTGFWSSAAAHVRADWIVGPAVSLEAQLGAMIPFVRYRFDAVTGGEVTRSAPLDAEAALGISFRL